jgi:membrane protein DedA with SNARE-associated domain
MYGLRIAGPIVIGTSRVSPLRFAAFNFLGAVLWALLIGGLGYAFGEAIEMMLQDVKHYERAAVIAIVVLGVAIWLYGWIRRRRMRARAG